jgi:hypothetical protein
MNNPFDLLIHVSSPWPGYWMATPDGYDGTRCEHDPRQNDNRIGIGRTKWDAMLDLIETMEQLEADKSAA